MHLARSSHAYDRFRSQDAAPLSLMARESAPPSHIGDCRNAFNGVSHESTKTRNANSFLVSSCLRVFVVIATAQTSQSLLWRQSDHRAARRQTRVRIVREESEFVAPRRRGCEHQWRAGNARAGW